MKTAWSSWALVLALTAVPALAGPPSAQDRTVAQQELQRLERAVKEARPRGPARGYATLAERHVQMARRALDRGAIPLANVLLRNAAEFLALSEGRAASLPPAPFAPAETQQ